MKPDGITTQTEVVDIPGRSRSFYRLVGGYALSHTAGKECTYAHHIRALFDFALQVSFSAYAASTWHDVFQALWIECLCFTVHQMQIPLMCFYLVSRTGYHLCKASGF